jgi:hypothetical protein
MRDYKIGIAIKGAGIRDKTVMFNTGFTSVEDAVSQANEVITKKFGSREQLELTRPHRNRRN